MQTWEQIINTALLGTDKRGPGANELPPELAEAAALIQQSTTDKEDQFLQMAALAFNYRQCGSMPLKKESVTIEKAAQEEKQYCSLLAVQTLKDILDSESNSLLQFWLQQCSDKGRIVTPEFVPLLMNTGIQQKSCRTWLLPVAASVANG